MNVKVKTKHIVFIALAPVIIGLISMVMYGNYVGFSVSNKATDWSYFGTFSAGILGPAIALSALFSIIYGLIIQSKEFNSIRNQFELQSIENTIKSHKSSKTMIIEQFSFTEKQSATDHNGEQHFYPVVFSSLNAIHELGKILTLARNSIYGEPKNYTYLSAYNKYIRVYEEYQYFFDTYFRANYHYIVYIDELSETHPDIASREITIYKAQLSSSETIFHYCNSLEENKYPKMRDLVIKHGILEHIPYKFIKIVGRQGLNQFPIRAYGTNYDKISAQIEPDSTGTNP